METKTYDEIINDAYTASNEFTRLMSEISEKLNVADTELCSAYHNLDKESFKQTSKGESIKEEVASSMLRLKGKMEYIRTLRAICGLAMWV